jgi:hypothetical protein
MCWLKRGEYQARDVTALAGLAILVKSGLPIRLIGRLIKKQGAIKGELRWHKMKILKGSQNGMTSRTTCLPNHLIQKNGTDT